MTEPPIKLTLRQRTLVNLAMVLGMTVVIGFPLVVMAAMFGVTRVSHNHLTGLPLWGKATILALGLGLTAWTTWFLDPAFNKSWREFLLRSAAWPAYAIFSGSVNMAPIDSPRVRVVLPFVMFNMLMLFDLRFRSEPQVLRLRDRLRGEAEDPASSVEDAQG